VLPAVAQVSSLKFVISMESLTLQSAVPIHLWDAVLAMGRTRDDDIGARVAALKPDDTACLIHTSGTGGLPKGAMLSHRGILANCRGAHEVLKGFGLGQEVFLSFLPLSHAYEHTAGFIFPLTIGAEIYFSTGAENLGAEMAEVRPTIMTAVPRLYEMLHRRITQGVERKGGLTAKLFSMTLELGLKRLDGKTLGPIGALKNLIGDTMVRGKMRQRFGGRLKAFVSGGGPLNVEIGRFFLALGVNVLQGYGQTESSPVISVNPPGRIRIETVGPPVAEVEVKLAEDGEILVSGPVVMKGYWNDAEATARTIKDGWLHTGDVGVIDPDGYIRITDRKRDFIKTTGGEMVAPQRVEGFLTLQPGVAQAMVYGDRRNYIVALVVPDEALIKQDAAEQRKHIGAAVDAANRMLSPLERIRRFAVIDEPFTIDNNRMTPTLKIRRVQITKDYAEVLEGLYKST
jgi:long-chain acyl-CoA synthetase